MLKRNVAILLLAGLVVGGGAVAWARSDAERPTLLTGTASSPAPDGTGGADPSAGATRRAAVQKCLADAGIQRGSGGRPTADQRAKARQCLQAARLVNGRPGGRGPGSGFFRRAVHGDLVVRGTNGQFENVTLDKGKDAGLSGEQLTISRADGKSVTVTITPDTRFKGVQRASELRQGQPVVVVSKDGKALLVAQRPARAAAGDSGNGTQAPAATPTDDNLS